MINDQDESPDDALEDAREVKLDHNLNEEVLPEDNAPPFSPPSQETSTPVVSNDPDDDTDVDETEEYQEG